MASKKKTSQQKNPISDTLPTEKAAATPSNSNHYAQIRLLQRLAELVIGELNTSRAGSSRDT